MNCEEFALQTQEWMEGRRTDEARAHAMACERCRSFVEDLDAIRVLAPQLALNAEPPERLWRTIHAQMEKEGLIRHVSWPSRVVDWIRIPSRPLAAAAAAALVFAVLMLTVIPRPSRQAAPPAGSVWLSANEAELTSIDTQLAHVERRTMGSFRAPDPQVENTLQQNLMIVNHQIARCEKTLEEAPADQSTRDYLYYAYQQKADLLNLMAEPRSGVTE